LKSHARLSWAGLVRQRIFLWTVGALTIVGCILRLAFLFRPMAYDESAAYMSYASPPLIIGLSNYFHPGNHMFHTLLVHISTRFLGSEPWVIRLPALCAGVLFVPLAYVVTRQLWGAGAGLLTAAMVTGSACLVDYSTNARGYMLGAVLFFVQLGLADYVREHDNRVGWVLLALASALSVFTVSSMLYGVGIVFTWLLLSLDRSTLGRTLSRIVTTAVAVVFLTLMLYSPALLVAGISQMTSQEVLTRWPLPQFAGKLGAALLRAWNFWHQDISLALRVLLGGAFCLALAVPRQVLNRRSRLLAAAPLFMLPVLIVHRAVPPARVLLFLWPFYVAIGCAGVAYALRLLSRGYAELAAAVLAVVLAVAVGGTTLKNQARHENDYGRFYDGREVSLFLRAQLQETDRVVAVAPAFAPLRYYFCKLGIGEEPLARPWGASCRLFVVVNRPTDSLPQSVDEVLAVKRVPVQEFDPPVLVRRFRYASLYEMRRRSTTDKD